MFEIIGIALLFAAGLHGRWGHLVPWKGATVKGYSITPKAVGLAAAIALGEIFLMGASTLTFAIVNGIALFATNWKKEQLTQASSTKSDTADNTTTAK
jgi:hypothetical protein